MMPRRFREVDRKEFSQSAVAGRRRDALCRSLQGLPRERRRREAGQWHITASTFQKSRQRCPCLAATGGAASVEDVEPLVAIETQGEKAERQMKRPVLRHG